MSASVPPPAGMPPAAATGGYPATFDSARPDRIARWRPFVHLILAIPHLIVMYALSLVSGVLVFVGWILGVFTGRVPDGILSIIAMVLRYNARVEVYLFFLREEYPPFAFDTSYADPGTYPGLTAHFTPRFEDRNRLTIFFRYFMIIPHVIVLFFLGIGLYIVLVLGFFAVLFTGNWPSGLRNYVVGMLRWGFRVNAYLYLMTDEYPPFSFE